jgi:hypothetical protein
MRRSISRREIWWERSGSEIWERGRRRDRWVCAAGMLELGAERR